MLTTTDIGATVAYYTETLGFVCDDTDETLGWATVHRDDVRIMFDTPNAHIPFKGLCFTGSLYVYIDDPDALWEAIKDVADICYPIETFDYGMREFGIYDNNGYLLKFGRATDNSSGT